MRQSRPKWAQDLAAALKALSKSNHRPITKLLKGAGVSSKHLAHIRTGDCIVGKKEDVEDYAKIFTRFNLPEADPRTVPPLVKKIPSAADIMTIRAWTDEEYNNWLVAQSKEYPSNRGEAPLAIRTVRVVRKRAAKMKETIGSEDIQKVTKPPTAIEKTFETLLDEFISGSLKILAKQLAPYLALYLLPELAQLLKTDMQQTSSPEKLTGKSSLSIEDLAISLHTALQVAVSGSSEDRDRFLTRHGRSLARLVPILEILTRGDIKSREESIPFLRGER